MHTILAAAARALLALVALATVAAPAAAQTRERWLKSPVLVFQPGVLFSDAIDAPDGADARTELLLRLVTAVPTAVPRTMLVLAVQWAPLADEDAAGVSRNQPELHYGPVFHLLDGERIGLDLGVLGAYGPSATAADAEERAYSHKLRVQGDLLVKLGALLSATPSSPWRRLGAYASLANTATGIDADLASRWSVQAGISIPLAP